MWTPIGYDRTSSQILSAGLLNGKSNQQHPPPLPVLSDPSPPLLLRFLDDHYPLPIRETSVGPRDPYAILTLENPTSSDDARSCLYTDPESDSEILFGTSLCPTGSNAGNLSPDDVEDNIGSSRFSTSSPNARP